MWIYMRLIQVSQFITSSDFVNMNCLWKLMYQIVAYKKSLKWNKKKTELMKIIENVKFLTLVKAFMNWQQCMMPQNLCFPQL